MHQVKSRPNTGETKDPIVDPIEIALYQGLLAATLTDVADHICTYTEEERERDMLEITRRVRAEGIAFLTKALPAFAKAIDRALATDTRLLIRGFARKRGSVLPCFLHGLTSLVFDSAGSERSDASVDAVMMLRQIGFMFYKLQLPFAEEDVDRVIDNFVTTDKHLELNIQDFSNKTRWCMAEARRLIYEILAPHSPYDEKKFSPRHGPGAVATGEKGCEKGRFRRYYKALAAKYPYETYFFYNSTHLCDELGEYLSLEELEAGTAKVVLVPKDSRGPRLISCEPLEYQWIQQGQMRLLVEIIENHRHTRGLVNFANQQVNRDLALHSSLDGWNVTLDMKDASDRVSLRLVEELFPRTWFEALSASRSTHTRLPNGDIVPLRKFAPMGSAVCFPVEALIFWALATAASTYYRTTVPLVLNNEPIRVYVYGDDIICNWADHPAIIQLLEEVGLKVNLDKCCTGSHFRESCGMDAYKGNDVTPVKIRARYTSSLAGMEYPSWVSYANSLRSKGFSFASRYLEDKIQEIKVTPYSPNKEIAVIAFHEPNPKMAIWLNDQLRIRTRYNRKRHCKQIAGWVVRTRVYEDTGAQGWSELQRIATLRHVLEKNNRNSLSQALLVIAGLAPANTLDIPQWFISIEHEESIPVKAYQYTLPRRCSLKRGWATL